MTYTTRILIFCWVAAAILFVPAALAQAGHKPPKPRPAPHLVHCQAEGCRP